MKHTIEVLNELEGDGVFSRYAIGGAMGAIFYTEPFLTFDLDVFVVLPGQGGGLLSLSGIYEEAAATRLQRRAGMCRHRRRAGAIPGLQRAHRRALEQARETDYVGMPTRVLRAEHLVAICLQTGRTKDRARVTMLREQAQLDMTKLADILKRHQLEERWKEWTT